MDSYWNEILLCDDLRLVPRFADFLYDWFYNFSYNSEECKIELA